MEGTEGEKGWKGKREETGFGERKGKNHRIGKMGRKEMGKTRKGRRGGKKKGAHGRSGR